MDAYLQTQIEDRMSSTTAVISDNADKYKVTQYIKKSYILFVAPYIIFGAAIWAAYLSWKCSNFKHGSMLTRLFKMLIAATLNVFYILYYFLTKSDVCYILKRLDEVDLKNKKKKI
jgi:hypothetical protein